MPRDADLEKRLKELKQADWVEQRVSAVRSIAGAECWLRFHAFDLHPANYFERQKLEQQADQFCVSAMPDDERRQFFKSLFPKLADTLERAWQDLAGTPYLVAGANPTSFRAPRHEVIVARIRDSWLRSVVLELRGYDPDPVWLATWGGHLLAHMLGYSSYLLAAAMDAGGSVGDEVFEILKQSACGQHDVAVMGAHVIAAMLQCERPEAWDFIEKMLLSAQREEGLRQSILESLPDAHPEAFRRFLGVIAREDLVRFASTVRAIDVWFGFQWDAMSTAHARSIVERTIRLLDSAKERAAALAGKDAETAYLALWCEAHHDAPAAAGMAETLLAHRSAEMRWIGVHALAVMGLPESLDAMMRALADADLRVAARALDAIQFISPWTRIEYEDAGDDKIACQLIIAAQTATFEALLGLFRRIKGEEAKFKPLVFPWGRSKLSAEEVGQALVAHCPPDRGAQLVGLLERFNAQTRASAAWLIAGRRRWRYLQFDNAKNAAPLSDAARTALIAMLGDPASDVRAQAAFWVEQSAVTPEEAARHEELCDRAASDIRTRAIARLNAQPDDAVLASAGRLLAGSSPRALAGLELLRTLIEQNRLPDAARSMASALRDTRKKLPKDLQVALRGILTPDARPSVRKDDAFGLARPFTPRPIPVAREFAHVQPSRAAVACIWSLDDLVEANKTMELKAINDEGEQERLAGSDRLLGSLNCAFWYAPSRTLTIPGDRERCSVLELVDQWNRGRGEETRDEDGHELVRAWLILQEFEEDEESPDSRSIWTSAIRSLAPRGRTGLPRHADAIGLLIEWTLRLHGEASHKFFLDQLEGAIHRRIIAREEETPYSDKREPKQDEFSAKKWQEFYENCPANWSQAHDIESVRRLEGLVRAANSVLEAVRASEATNPSSSDGAEGRDERLLELKCDHDDFVRLWGAGDVSDDELLIRVMHSEKYSKTSPLASVPALDALVHLRRTGKNSPSKSTLITPRLDAIFDRVRRRVLEIELARGDAPTPATPHAFALDPSGGIDAAIPALAGLGHKLKLARGHLYQNFGKAASFSSLIQHSSPGPDDTPAAFAAAAKTAGLSDERLVELALYQPRWAAHVEHATGWAGLEEGALWLRAHTKERKENHGRKDDLEPWEAKVAELTPVPSDSLADGAVDRAWFQRCYKKLGPKRWEVLYEAAKYASSGGGHARARLFADAMLGELSEKELLTRIAVKRHQDAARALGLLELKAGDAGRKQVMARFKALQEMRRTSRKHGGSMLQASEKRAVEIGMENLAWTAGYPDPLRLQWAMEIEEFGDLAKGPVIVKAGETTVTLAVDDDGQPSLTAAKGNKPLKSIPPTVKKDKRVAPLAERLTELRRQGSRIRQSLEQSMCRGDSFRGAELVTLFGHPLLKSLLTRLVMIGTTKSGAALLGYPDKGGKALRRVDGTLEPIRATDTLRVAHPLDLLATKQWHDWQAECFRAERVQPFKQIFREVYLPIASETEKKAAAGGDRTARYAGQQVQPRQALALFGARGWVARPEEGVQRTFHAERVTVRVEFEEGFYTPAEIDGLTLAGASFAHAGTLEPLAIREVPPRVFSEIMRDLDLVVSVAHRSGVDPEASQSTVEMRAALLRETSALLSLRNIRFEKSRAIIKGELGEYALHLGSGTIHMLPGGTLWVIPVHSQYRGRVFLPFADNDPQTAEIMSKALLLARDREIRDPAILAQIRAR